ncbi:MAG: FecR domain-containing protein [Tannerella sp.]|nr:FecR domain-containing protein [Tannerella sp.]
MNERLTKYFTRAMSEKEKEDLFRDMDSDAALRKEFAEQRNLWAVLTMNEQTGDAVYAYRRYRRLRERMHTHATRSLVLQVLKYAAIVALTIGLWSVYQYQRHGSPQAVTCIETPVGQRTHLVLPDGTNVWLNAQTRLSYLSDFSPKNRQVQLEGEAFFEVKSDRKHPFYVSASGINVKVTGTTFNFSAYANETSTVTLVKGRVEVTTSDGKHKLTLQPDEQASFSEQHGLSFTRTTGAEQIHLWTKGEFYYLNEPLSHIAHDLERRFGVSISIEDEELARELYTYHASENTTPEQILRHLKATKSLDYIIKKNQIQIIKLKK